jgi:hypothetical protein
MLKNKIFYLLSLSILLISGIGLAVEDAAIYKYNSQGRRDPFIPIVTTDGRLIKVKPEGGVTGLALEGIILDENGVSYAMINGDVVKIGDDINGFEVLKIEDNKVILIKDGEPLEIELNKEER